MTRHGRRARTLLAVAASATLLLACGGSDDDAGDEAGDEAAGADADGDVGEDASGDAESSGGGAGTWSGELEDGSTLVVRLAEADDAAVAPFEEFRQAVEGPEVEWMVAEVTVPDDVADGTGTGRYLTLVADGADIMADDPSDPADGVTAVGFACSSLTDWLGTSPTEDTMAAYNEVYSGPCAGNVLGVLAPSGATTTYVLVHPAPLPEFSEVYAGLTNQLSAG